MTIKKQYRVWGKFGEKKSRNRKDFSNDLMFCFCGSNPFLSAKFKRDTGFRPARAYFYAPRKVKRIMNAIDRLKR